MYEPKCKGCSFVSEVAPYAGNAIGIGCAVYRHPMAARNQWRRGACPMATHVKRAENGNGNGNGKVRVGQQKQRKSHA